MAKNPLKERIIGKTATFIRSLDEYKHVLKNSRGECMFCGTEHGVLCDVECPMFKVDSLRADLNLLFFGIKDTREAEKHEDAL